MSELINPKVVDKKHYPAANLAQPYPVMTMTGDIVQTTIPIMAPEAWSLVLDGLDKKGRTHLKEVYVDQITYNTTKLGDPYGRG